MLKPARKTGKIIEVSPHWLQELIAMANFYGISKRELFEDYYLDEIAEVLKQCAKLRNITGGAEDGNSDVKYVGAGEFFGG